MGVVAVTARARLQKSSSSAAAAAADGRQSDAELVKSAPSTQFNKVGWIPGTALAREAARRR